MLWTLWKIILINENGKLIRQSLPNEGQIAPVKSSVVADVNEDGFNDIIIVGNHYGVEVETPRYDAGFGAVFLNDGKANFNFSVPKKSGFYIPKDSRSIMQLSHKNKTLFIVTNNNSQPSVVEAKGKWLKHV